jgi:hypothetical protein
MQENIKFPNLNSTHLCSPPSASNLTSFVGTDGPVGSCSCVGVSTQDTEAGGCSADFSTSADNKSRSAGRESLIYSLFITSVETCVPHPDTTEVGVVLGGCSLSIRRPRRTDSCNKVALAVELRREQARTEITEEYQTLLCINL